MNLLFPVRMLAVTVPAEITDTINNLTTAGQIIGGSLASVFLIIAAIQFMTGGRNNVEVSKTRIICVIVGMILVAGCSVIKTFIDGLMAF
ncbi:MAG: Conjugal transfer protein [Oscillospiraceae bacterium]|jgi:hypothetical protein